MCRMLEASVPGTETATTVEPVGCHVVWMPDLIPTRSECATLSPEIVAAVHRGASPLRKPERVVEHLRKIIDSHQLEGIAMFWAGSTHRSLLPPPLEVPFEPTELNERQPELRWLCRAAPNAPESNRKLPKPLSLWRNLAVSLFVGYFLVSLGIQIVAGIRSGNPAAAVLPSLHFLIMSALVLILYMRRRRNWLLVPRGVLERQPALGWWGGRIRRYTPQDTVLLIRPSRQGYGVYWDAELWQQDRRTARMLTSLECHALLAAWQSPIPPPEAEQLTELS